MLSAIEIEKDLLKTCCYTGPGDERDPTDIDKRNKGEIINDIYHQVKEKPDLLPIIKAYCENHHDSEYTMHTVYLPLLEKLYQDPQSEK